MNGTQIFGAAMVVFNIVVILFRLYKVRNIKSPKARANRLSGIEFSFVGLICGLILAVFGAFA